MARCVRVAAVLFVLVGSAHVSVGQVRNAQASGQQPPAGGARQPPAPSGSTAQDRGFTSTLKLVPAPSDARPMPFPFHTFGWESFDFVPFWSWNIAMPGPAYSTASAVLVPSEGAPLGGLQLDVQPWRAQVYVDGAYAGLVEDFRGYYRHLELAAGPHQIAIVAPDHRPLVIEVITSPGFTSTYRGTLQRQGE